MCIICNVTDLKVAEDFLGAFAAASTNMRKAEAAMLRCAARASDPIVGASYKQAHKAMVRARKQWNAIEHQREACATNPPA